MDEEQKDEEVKSEAEIDNESEPAAEPKPVKKIPIGGSHWHRFRNWYASHKKWSIPATILVLLVILGLVPWSRYKTTGLILKKDYTIWVIDSKTKTPVSGADVSSGSVKAMTDGNGAAKLANLKVGKHSILVSKKYYSDLHSQIVVPILSEKQPPHLSFNATGRQVKIVVKNLISQKALADVDLEIADITAKTDSSGEAIIVLPVGTTSEKASLSLDGFNDSTATIKVSDSKIQENDLNLTPTGKIYFLSKRTGKLDLMKVNLDGSEAQTVLAGTGTEQDSDTVLLPSPDWKYVALISKRKSADPTPQLYVLSTDDDQLLSVDSGNANFTLEGWAGNSLIYYVTRNDLKTYQSGKDKLKSYNATTGRTTLLDQNSAAGDEFASAYEFYASVTISGSEVVFSKNWTLVYGGSEPSGLIDGKKNTLAIIGSDGQGHKVVASYDATSNVQYKQHSPDGIYIWEQTKDSTDKFYDYTIGAAAPKDTNLTSDKFYQLYPAYYSSPSGRQTFWAENRDGKNTLFVGDDSANNPLTIASLVKYEPYGWFSDQYLLVTQNNSEMFIVNAKPNSSFSKITDFQPTSSYGYGHD